MLGMKPTLLLPFPIRTAVASVMTLIALVATTAPCSSSLLADEAGAEIPKTGQAIESLEPYDRIITEFMQHWKLPGCSIAVAKDGKLILSRGYGWADFEKQQPVQPDSLFRLASLSKPITAVAVLALVEQGKLKLDDKAISYISQLQPADGAEIDEQFKQVTIDQLLRHTGGWDRNKSFDPMFRSRQIAEALKLDGPADSSSVIRYMLGRELNFSPGERYAYSNFGYCVLGRVIEKVTGKDYEVAVKELVLGPCGVNGMRIGCSKVAQRCDGEVCYVMPGDKEKATSVFPNETDKVAWPYGGFYLEAMDAHGGWIGSAVDLVKFSTSLAGSREPRLLKPETIELMLSRGPHTPASDASYYGHGWLVRPIGDSGPLSSHANWWHSGSLPGTSTVLVHTAAGFDWAILFSARPEHVGIDEFHTALDAMLWKAFHEVQAWPEHDLF